MRLQYVRPPLTTFAQCARSPASCSSCRRVVFLLPSRAASASVIFTSLSSGSDISRATVSMSIPKNLTLVAWEVTFRKLI